MISSDLGSFLQLEVTSPLISDAKSSSVPLGESNLSLASTVGPRDAPTLATFAGILHLVTQPQQ